MRSARAAILAGGLAAVAVVCATAALSPDSEPPARRVQQALRQLAEDELDQAERQALALAIDDHADSYRAWLLVAEARERQGRHDDAASAYRRFLARCSSPELREYALAQIRRCERAARPPQPLQAPSDRLTEAQRRRLAVVEEDTSTEYSPHFVVRARNSELARLVTQEAERALSRICNFVLAGQEFPHVVDVHVWPDAESYQQHATDSPEWSGGSYSVRRENGVTRRRIDLTQRDADGRFATVMLDRVLPHELCHLVVDDFFGDSACPLLIDEGLAMLAESQVDNQRVLLAGAALAGTASLPLERLVVRQRYDLAQQAPLFYAEAFSFTEFLHSRLNRQQFRDLLGHLKSGCTVGDAVQRALYLPSDEQFLPELSAAWEEYAITQAQYVRALNGNLAAEKD